MLVIRMQRTGRKGHAQFRVVVQDSRRTPTSGKIVAKIGHFNPHTKEAAIDKEKAGFYLEHGAQPSERVARLFKSEGVKLPSWVKDADKRSGTIRNPEKLRRNRPAGSESEEAAPAAAPESAEDDGQAVAVAADDAGAVAAEAAEPEAAEETEA